MKWLLRPSLLIVASAAFVVGAVAVALRTGPALARPAPLPVAPGDREVVWLYPATNPVAWERFVAAVRRAPEALRKDLPAVRADVDPAQAFPQHTTAVPEVALSLGPDGGRLVFRWYKLTGDWNTRDWVEALLKRSPPPLAVIGGSSSEAARDLAWQLKQAGDPLPEDARPLLLLTTATADRVADPVPGDGPPPAPGPPAAGEEPDMTPGVPLNDLYLRRTFRFCFTNRQMAGRVTNFLWSQPDLRPDRDPVYMVRWEDDSYSRDLIEGFWKALKRLEERGQFAMNIPPTPQVIDSSVGGFARPNSWEANVARDLLDLRQAQEARQKRPLLVLTGQSAPSRRFLRALVRSAPDRARQFVVATGDAIAFNTVYRDRGVAWHVQDLPLPLAFFCHRNPVDPGAGFRPLPADRGGAAAGRPSGSDLAAATGTEDVLLYGDIVEALAQAQRRGGRAAANATEVAAGLAELRALGGHIGFGPGGTQLFNPESFGRRRWGTGEHIVCLRPHVKAGRVLPEATIGVWAWHGRPDQGPQEGEWRPVGQPLHVNYDQSRVEGGGHE